MSGLSDLQAEMTEERDEPKPGQKRRGRPPGSTNRSSKASVQKELESQLLTMLKMTAMVWSTRDPICGPVLNQQSEAIANDIAKLAAGNKHVQKYLKEVTQIGQVVPLMMHLTPVLTAVHAHHIAKTVQVEQEAVTDAYQQGFVG